MERATEPGLGGADRPAQPAPSAERWAPSVVALAVVAVVVGWLFWSGIEAAVSVWYGSTSYNHCFVILPICGYLVWLRRDILARLAPRPFLWGVVPLVAASMIGVVGQVTGTDVLQQVAVVAMIQAAVLVLFGIQITRALIFPLAYMYFAVPIGIELEPWLQDVTATITVAGLRAVGIPVFHDGVFITIPTGHFEVAEACSGLRFLLATLALGFLCSGMLFRAWWRRGVFMVLSVVVPIIANGGRAFGIVMLAHLTDHRLAVGVDHIIYGWVFFAFITFVLLGIAMWMRDGDPELSVPDSAGAAAASPGLRTVSAAVVAAVVGVGGVPVLVYGSAPSIDTASVIDVQAPSVRAPWRPASDGTPVAWTPRFPGADGTASHAYVGDGTRVDLFVAYYVHQREGAEVVAWGNRLVDDRVWKRVGGTQVDASVAGSPLKVSLTRMTSVREKRVAMHWFWVDGRFTSDRLVAKLLQAKVAILGGNRSAAAIFVSTPYDERATTAVETLRAYLASLETLDSKLEQASLR